MHEPGEQFVSEPIEPTAGAFSVDLMRQGLAALPAGFVWRGQHYRVIECIDHVKQTARERHAADGERYLRRQQFRVRLDSGHVATIYFERQARPGTRGSAARKRWYLYTITPEHTPGD